MTPGYSVSLWQVQEGLASPHACGGFMAILQGQFPFPALSLPRRMCSLKTSLHCFREKIAAV